MTRTSQGPVPHSARGLSLESPPSSGDATMNVILFILLPLILLDEPKDDPTAHAQKARRAVHQALLKEYFNDPIAGEGRRRNYFAARFSSLAEEDPNDFVGFDSLSWLVRQGGVDHPEFAWAMDRLSRHHAKEKQIGDLC